MKTKILKIISINFFIIGSALFSNEIKGQNELFCSEILSLKKVVSDSIYLPIDITRISSLAESSNKNLFLFETSLTDFMGMKFAENDEYVVYLLMSHRYLLFLQSQVDTTTEFVPLIGLLIYSKTFDQFLYIEYFSDLGLYYTPKNYLLVDYIIRMKYLQSVSVVDYYFNTVYQIDFDFEIENIVIAEFMYFKYKNQKIQIKNLSSSGLSFDEVSSKMLFTYFRNYKAIILEDSSRP